MPTDYIEIDGHRRTVAEWSDQGFGYAVAAKSAAEANLACALFGGLLDQCQGRGLISPGSASSDTGKHTVMVVGSIDLIALARRALAAQEKHPMSVAQPHRQENHHG